MGKKEQKKENAETEEIDFEERLKNVNQISLPLVDKKLNKKVLKLVKKASKNNSVRRGVKEVVKSLRKKVVGVVFIAGDISPIDVVTHLPVLCEDHNIPYVFVPSKEDLGSAGSTKRPTSVIMVPFKKDVDYADAYKEVYDEVKELNSK